MPVPPSRAPRSGSPSTAPAFPGSEHGRRDPERRLDPEILLAVHGLDVDRPDGSALLHGVELELRRGEIVALLGGSGAGKSTLVTALHDPERLRAAGFRVACTSLERRASVGLVPQRGALFDHLDVAGNLALAMRNAAEPKPVDAGRLQAALASVDLPTDWLAGVAVGRLSGGEAQRLAVARTLAGGREILILDEPSVGLDPLRVELLADLLRAEIRRRQATALVITHELEFAAGFADRFLFMDPHSRRLIELPPLGDPERRPEPPVDLRSEPAQPRAAELSEDPGSDPSDSSPSSASMRELSAERRPRALRRAIAEAVTDDMVARLAQAPPTQAPSSPVPGRLARSARALAAGARQVASATLGGLEVGPRVLAQLGRAALRPRDFSEVFGPVLRQALWRPAAFFGVVSVLIGFTLLYILHRSIGGGELPILPERVFSLIGSMHVIALAPPLSGILFASTSANALIAWLGGMSLTRQTTALRGLGIEETRYLWVPAWLGLVGAYLILAALFALGMLVGGVLYIELRVPEFGGGWSAAWELLTADLVDPPPERAVFRVRALVLVALYALGIASDAVAEGAREKNSAQDVTVAMVRGVMVVTLWIVALELGSLVLIY